MLHDKLNILACPICGGGLMASNMTMDGDNIVEGVLRCSCGAAYVLAAGAPRMLPRRLYMDEEVFERLGLPLDSPPLAWPDDCEDWSQEMTSESFHREWSRYASFGWEHEDASMEDTFRWLLQKTLLRTEDISGKLVLDAGCGNGRYSYAAFQSGADVVSMDLGRQVDVAVDNLRDAGLTPFGVQGDILHPPFKSEAFGAVFCIGVLQHTGAPKRAAESLAGLLAPSGLLSIRAYRKGNDRLEENDEAIRRATTSFNEEDLMEFCDILHRLSAFLIKKNLFLDVAKHINIFERQHDLYDWYSAPVAHKLTYKEMRRWFAECGLRVLRDADDNIPRRDRKFDAISILGERT